MKKFFLPMLLVPVLSAQTFSACDINHDGVVNVVDVQLMINQALGMSPCTADLNHDGVCNVLEVQIEIVAALTGVCNATAPASIAITPATGSTVSATTVFSVDASNAPATASVEFDLGSLRLGLATAPPFNLSWNTGFAADGRYSLLAKAYDSSGNILAQATTVVNINNHGGAVTLNSPDLSRPLSGVVSLSITGLDGQGYYPARWNLFLDGQALPITWTDNSGQNPITISPSLDTTTVPNGVHEIHIEAASNYWTAAQPNNKTWYSDHLGLSQIITTNNGHTLMGVTAGYQHVYLQPNQTFALSCGQLFTDNTTGPCAAPSYTSSDPSTLTVNASGLLTAGSNPGFATVTLTESGKSTQAYVWVTNNSAIPHFAGNGQMLAAYQAGQSIFPVAPFVLGPSDLRADASLNAETKRAGVNTLYGGFYLNPRDITKDYAAWQSNYDGAVGSNWTWAANNGYHLYTMGDDAVRNIGGDAWWTLNWPSGQQAVQHAMESLAGSGVAIAIDMIDEGSMMWGWTPTPPRMVGESGMFTSITCGGATCAVTWPNNPVTPNRFFAGTSFALTGSLNAGLNTPLGQMFQATNVTSSSFDFVPAAPVTGTFTSSNDPNLEFLWWAGGAGGCPANPCNPPVPNTALSSVAGWLRTATPHVPISWPALGSAPLIIHDQWAGKDSQVSDFMSHYWDTTQPGATYTWASGVAERNTSMRSTFYSRQPDVRLDRPQIILGSISSFFYTKETPNGAYYNPPQDVLIGPGTSPAAVSAEIMTAAALGNAGIRLYQYERLSDTNGRANAALGSQEQTGTNPFSGDQKAVQIWKSLGYTANVLTKTLTPFVLNTPLPSPDLGDSVVTAARQGVDGKMLMAINATDWVQTVTLNLTPYRTGNNIARYTVGGTEIKTTLISDAPSDTVTLNAGETVVYLFPTLATTSYLVPFPVAAPTLPTGAAAAWLHQGYIYSQDLDSQTAGIPCTSGCSLQLDRTLGAVFYQFFFVDSQGKLLGKSPATTVPGQ